MAKGDDERHNPKRKVGKEDFLSSHGMTPEQQHTAEMNAANVPVSELEWERAGTRNLHISCFTTFGKNSVGISHA